MPNVKMDLKESAERNLPDRRMLIAYLQYAMDDLTKIDGVSAILVEAAIGNLKKRQSEERSH